MRISPKQMEKMMKKMGMKQKQIDASQVIIVTPEHNIVIENPSVMKVNAMGQENYQISGEERIERRETKAEINDEDIKTVMEKSEVDEKTAKEALEKSEGDIAQAIIDLKE